MKIRTDIKEIIKSHGKKAADLSRDMNINYDTLNSYLNGRKEIPAKVEEQIFLTLKVWGYVQT